MAVKIVHEKASYLIHMDIRFLGDLAQKQKLLMEHREKATREGDTDDLSLRIKSIAGIVTKIAQELPNEMETAKHMPASLLKSRGQWIASLISSGVLPGWSARIEVGLGYGEQRILMRKLTGPLHESDKKDGITFTG